MSPPRLRGCRLAASPAAVKWLVGGRGKHTRCHRGCTRWSIAEVGPGAPPRRGRGAQDAGARDAVSDSCRCSDEVPNPQFRHQSNLRCGPCRSVDGATMRANALQNQSGRRCVPPPSTLNGTPALGKRDNPASPKAAGVFHVAFTGSPAMAGLSELPRTTDGTAQAARTMRYRSGS